MSTTPSPLSELTPANVATVGKNMRSQLQNLLAQTQENASTITALSETLAKTQQDSQTVAASVAQMEVDMSVIDDSEAEAEAEEEEGDASSDAFKASLDFLKEDSKHDKCLDHQTLQSWLAGQPVGVTAEHPSSRITSMTSYLTTAGETAYTRSVAARNSISSRVRERVSSMDMQVPPRMHAQYQTSRTWIRALFSRLRETTRYVKVLLALTTTGITAVAFSYRKPLWRVLRRFMYVVLRIASAAALAVTAYQLLQSHYAKPVVSKIHRASVLMLNKGIDMFTPRKQQKKKVYQGMPFSQLPIAKPVFAAVEQPVATPTAEEAATPKQTKTET